ncbi:MAG: right-handed parallel beta-helix repeat-containing protein [Rikenellaceae bacterium]|nr:right-handed parallel beta-helix repeat-containing protein [Rikenellaceae bacterium]
MAGWSLKQIAKLAVCSVGVLLGACGDISQREVSVEKFGALPDDGQNDFEALRRATDYCRENPGTTLRFPAGQYDIDHPLARKIEFEAISGAYGERVQATLFRPDAPYVKAVELAGCDNTTIKAQGATLMLHGWYEVLSIERAEGVTIEGISIRYNRPPATIGRVVESTKEWFDAEFDTVRYGFITERVTGRLHLFDHVRNRLYTGWAKSKELTAAGKIRFQSSAQPAVGDYFVLRHGGHYRPAVMIRECEDITLRDVKIHSQPGMGVVGHLTRDIMIDNLQVVPEAGSVISTNTDATHFTSCSGTVTIQNSKFKGQGDDCTNIHGYYYRIYPEEDGRVEMRIEGADLHAQWLDYPQKGDTMVVINSRSMAEQARYVVQSVDTSLMNWTVKVGLDRPIEFENPSDYYMWNRSRFPRVRILNNSVHSHLARSFLIKSRDVVIAGNCIQNSTLTAIKLGAELGWRESGPAENVLVENNYITDCGYVSGADAPSCITLSTEALERPPYLNRNIVIRNNVFDTDKRVAVLLRDAENVEVSNNMTTHPNYVRVENCQNIEIAE